MPVEPRPAATVVLVRDHPAPLPGQAPLQVFLQRRVAGMAFAGGMTVFPGGGVDPADRPEAAHWAGPDLTWWGERLACPAELAGALVHAAVRETFEECGVLLADPIGPAAATDTLADLARARADLLARRRTLAQVLAKARRVLRSDALVPWARWITPAHRPRRYDAVFFTARLPPGQVADDRTSEVVEASWWFPAQALQRWNCGDLHLMEPTARTLQEIAECPDVKSVLTAGADRTIGPVIPDLSRAAEAPVER